MAQLKDLLVSGAARFINGIFATGTSTTTDIEPVVTDTYSLGSPTREWLNVYSKQFTTGADGISFGGPILPNGSQDIGSATNKVNNIYATTFIGNLSGNATSASYPEGFASRSTTANWGNQTGSTITGWNENNGGSIEFRANNPSNGKMSVKVDGRFYGNEGNSPAMLMNSDGTYWGMGDADGNSDVWIRTTTEGILPSSSNSVTGVSSIGKSDWPFKEGYIQNIYGSNLGSSTYGFTQAYIQQMHGNADTATAANRANIKTTINAAAKYSDNIGTFSDSGVIIDGSNNITTPGSLYFTNPSEICWNSDTYRQRIYLTDDSNADTAVFNFQQSTDAGASWGNLLEIRDNGSLILTNNTGGIYRYQSIVSDSPVIQVNSNNQDTSILKVDGNNPTGVRNSSSYGFNLKYIGTGGAEDNALDLLADNIGSTAVTAVSISNNGKMGIGAKFNTNYRLYVNGTTYIAGNGFVENKFYVNSKPADYSINSKYSVGTRVCYQGTVYVCSTEITAAESWTPDHWTAESYQEYVTGTSYFTNTLDIAPNTVAINFRPNHASYTGTFSYQTGGNEALVLATKHLATSLIFINGEDSTVAANHAATRWQSLVPALQIKNNSVYIGSLIGQDVTPAYKFYVNGSAYFNSNDANTDAVGVTINNGKLAITNFGNTITIGSSNANWAHFTSTQPFYFNTTMSVDGNVLPYSTQTYNLGSSTGRWKAVFIGTADSYGTTSQPIYWKDGVPTPLSDTVGSIAKPVYLNGGIITALSDTVGGTSHPVYMNAGTITALTDTVGSSAKPVYMSSGTITALSDTIGGTTTPVYVNAGTITALSQTVGNTAKPVYMSNGAITVISDTVGAATKPIYLNQGTLTVGTYELKATINAATQYGVAYYSTTTNLTSTAAGTSGYLLQAGGTTAAPSWIQATNTNVASTIVKRDASGNFSAGTITATLSGNASTASTASKVASALTFNNGGSGAASGATYDGSAVKTISYNTVGAPSTTGTNASGTWGINISGNAATATLGYRVQVLTADPASPAVGQIWVIPS